MRSSSLLLQIYGHLLRYFTKISPRRAKSTPAGNFCSCLVSASPIFKRLTQKGFSEAARMPLVPRGSDVFASQKLVVQKCTWKYIFEHACGCFLYVPRIYRTDTDVRGFMQQRCFCSAKTRVQKCTRMYTSGQAICKRLTANGDFQKANGKKAFFKNTFTSFKRRIVWMY